MNSDSILEVRHLKQYFHVNKHLTIKAIDDVSFQIDKGEIFGLVGETGSGKSTTARTIMGIYPPADGEVYFKGQLISDKKIYHKNKKEIQRKMQFIFQDSAAALNPRMTVEKIIAEPLIINHIINEKEELKKKIDSLLVEVGLDTSYKSKYPSELSGGQRQRVAIARSIGMSPDLIIGDEPIASLDISIQAQIVTLFQKLQKKHGFTFLFIAHDLSIIRFISDKVGVMLKGKMMEMAPAKELFENPLHPYTKALLSAVPVPDPIYERNKKILTYDEESIQADGQMVEVTPGHFVYK
ncbi:ATP-binding cassette domain-containing protein [Oceanobacillus chungangensis]|uniref:Peptide ABC transporter ATP-binding protein n=1 Tax=Oceanobacillus chungangensis TaxID=1229152 RepID=A0A3D8PU77_9BACI|nr:ATP-binding cassette domain-containing protein [Oceanobacillus chungangensis]RDW19710.1 peptide ABC transporter ATP-binding protein [Oceanobacillus chungangensis]